MKVAELYEVLSIYENIQIYNAKTAEPRTCVDSLCESDSELWRYVDDTIYGVVSDTTTDGGVYIKIMIEERV